MESDIIYSASSHLKSLVNWSEWVYCGIGDDIREEVIEKSINEHFQEAVLYFVTNRKESGQVNKQNILERIKRELGQIEFFLWDTNLKKVIEFNKIGVMRNGFVATTV